MEKRTIKRWKVAIWGSIAALVIIGAVVFARQLHNNAKQGKYIVEARLKLTNEEEYTKELQIENKKLELYQEYLLDSIQYVDLFHEGLEDSLRQEIIKRDSIIVVREDTIVLQYETIDNLRNILSEFKPADMSEILPDE